MGIFQDIEHGISKIYHGITGSPTAKQEREQQRLLNEQMEEYRKQTELAKQQLDEARESQMVEKRKIEEKQIRSLRHTYRTPSSGILGMGGSNDLNDKLGS